MAYKIAAGQQCFSRNFYPKTLALVKSFAFLLNAAIKHISRCAKLNVNLINTIFLNDSIVPIFWSLIILGINVL